MFYLQHGTKLPGKSKNWHPHMSCEKQDQAKMFKELLENDF